MDRRAVQLCPRGAQRPGLAGRSGVARSAPDRLPQLLHAALDGALRGHALVPLGRSCSRCRSRYGTTKTMIVPVRNGFSACPQAVRRPGGTQASAGSGEQHRQLRHTAEQNRHQFLGMLEARRRRLHQERRNEVAGVILHRQSEAPSPRGDASEALRGDQTRHR